MKGIKECVNWMLDNPMKEIHSNGNMKCRYDEARKEMQSNSGICWNVLYGLQIFDEDEWEEVKTPFTFEEAYKLCKGEGVSFIGTGYAVDALMKPNGEGVWIGSDHEQGMYINSNAVWFRK